MLAVDTNFIVRLLTADEPGQTATAVRLFEAESLFLSKTVLLETEWVLRRLYGFERPDLLSALRHIVELANVTCEDEPQVWQALDWAAEGMDFADAMHLASSRSARRFATFDRALINAAKTAGTT